ncbi:hypothetical protein GCM10028804_07630 [Larkinella terrae]
MLGQNISNFNKKPQKVAVYGFILPSPAETVAIGENKVSLRKNSKFNTDTLPKKLIFSILEKAQKFYYETIYS